MRLLQIEPASSLFFRKGSLWFPSLRETLKQLQVPQNVVHLSPAEVQLLLLLKQLIDPRHGFMHRVAPEQVDVSIAAMCMVGLLKYIERHHSMKTADFVDQSPPIESEVVAAIRANRLDDYRQLVELFLLEKYPNQIMPECPCCGVSAVVFSRCEACYEDLDETKCVECDETIFFFQGGFEGIEVQCPACGHADIV